MLKGTSLLPNPNQGQQEGVGGRVGEQVKNSIAADPHFGPQPNWPQLDDNYGREVKVAGWTIYAKPFVNALDRV